MALRLRYSVPSGVASWLVSGIIVVAFFAVPTLTVPIYAQNLNWGPSVTSLGFGGHEGPAGNPPSVTSMGFGRTGAQHGGGHIGFSNPEPQDLGSRHHGPYYPSYPYQGYYAYPVYIDVGSAYSTQPEPAAAATEDEYKGGPTIFDRRGNGQYEVPTTHRSQPVEENIEAKATPAPLPVAEVANQPQTVLRFKDGHETSVDNYAIIGNTLYDLSAGKRRKIPLADLDLKATAQQNDDRGIDFELPTGSATN